MIIFELELSLRQQDKLTWSTDFMIWNDQIIDQKWSEFFLTISEFKIPIICSRSLNNDRKWSESFDCKDNWIEKQTK